MQVIDTAIEDVKILIPRRHGDERGFFCETYNREAIARLGIECDWVQDNQAFSAERGVVRGLHFQLQPYAQDKLVRVSRGAILDVAVDIRPDSPTYGRHVAVELTADEGNQLLVPIGFAHGYCTLVPDTEVLYKVSNFYAPDYERSVLWNDPALAIPWPFGPADAILSEKDKNAPILSKVFADEVKTK
ncbi:dTDP-4-dehydrorhamnose 3,5-epimerase [candidate division GN15 bacterium]|nr:dTDP-4-dehydrorhamnose 3,5-epimerase [candidate division GN15 bacterium]